MRCTAAVLFVSASALFIAVPLHAGAASSDLISSAIADSHANPSPGRGQPPASVASALPTALPSIPDAGSHIDWQPWSDAAFVQARREHKEVLMDLHAVWCHWCHVMDVVTYADPQVAAYVNAHFVPVGVDQDSRPDISDRYENYGWPATIVFAPDRTEIVKRSGYIPPRPMLAMLKAIVADPTPGPSARPNPAIVYGDAAGLSEDQRARLIETFHQSYDVGIGGWGRLHKYLDWDNIEYAVARSLRGDAFADRVQVRVR